APLAINNPAPSSILLDGTTCTPNTVKFATEINWLAITSEPAPSARASANKADASTGFKITAACAGSSSPSTLIPAIKPATVVKSSVVCVASCAASIKSLSTLSAIDNNN